MRLPLLFLSLTALLVFSKKCTDKENKDQLDQCQILFSDLIGHVNTISTDSNITAESETMKNLTALCDKWTSCIGPNKCEDKQYDTDRIAMICEHPEFVIKDVSKCLGSVFKAIYKGDFECSQEYAFMAKNLTRKSESLINGQACFLNIIHQTCKQDAFNYINKNYQEIVNILTVNGETDTCQKIHHYITQMQCTPIAVELDDLNRPAFHKKASEEEKERARTLCRRGLNCMTKQCPSISTDTYHDFKAQCLFLEKGDTEFWQCADKAVNEAHWESYPCEKEIKALESKLADRCEVLKKKRECSKLVIKEKCPNGEEQDYEDYNAVFQNHLAYCV